MAKHTKTKEAVRFVKFAIYRLFKSVFSVISPTYRVALKNQTVLNHIYLMTQDLYYKGMSAHAGEPIQAKNLDEVDIENIERYKFAETLIRNGDNVLDIACGRGFGSYIMGEKKKAKITAVDISPFALEHAKKYFNRDNIEFICSSAEAFQPKKQFDVIVSFETIEHLKNDKEFIKTITKHLKRDGLFICSTPNEANVPYSILSQPFHYRHYTIRQMSRMLIRKGGLKIEAIYTQCKSDNYKLTKSRFGIYTVMIARKK